jgi:hypothetical protein
MVLEDNLEVRDGHWAVPLWKTCCTVPDLFLLAFACPVCVTYDHRYRLLGGDMSRYVCCGGMICSQCECLGGPELCQKCPRCCLVTEIALFSWCGCPCSANRAMAQVQWGIRNSKCDNCIICTACLLSWAFVIASIFLPIPIEGRIAADCVYLFFCAAFQSQLGAELRVREARPTVVEMKEPTSYSPRAPKTQAPTAVRPVPNDDPYGSPYV